MEAMALESLVASVWRLDGFLAVARHPLRVDRGYSDVDVVGVRGDGTIRVGECKARGPALEVNVDADGHGWSSWWDAGLANLQRLWEQRPAWLPPPDQIINFEFHLVGNVWFPDDGARQSAEARLLSAVKAHLPRGLKSKAAAVVTPSVELVLEAMRRVRSDVVEDGWGKRYGDPLLDALREMIRYAHARPAGGRHVRDTIRDEFKREFVLAIFGEG
ncbi:MAG: hypothetical protein ABJE95_04175 [Byssovorax sp.]